MFPELFRIGSFSMSTYGLMNMLGYLAAVMYLIKYKNRVGVSSDTIWNVMFISIISAIAGGKLFYILFEVRPTTWEEIKSVIVTFRYGFVFLGGFIVTVTALIIYLVKNKLPLVKMADFLIPGLPLGHAIGRIGCFLVGCCHGKPWDGPWAVTFTNPHSLVEPHLLGVPLHPTQIYEVIANFAIFAVLHVVTEKKHRSGSIVLLYAAMYGALRFIMEFFRGDYRGNFFMGFSPSQMVSLGLIIGAAILYFVFVRRGKTDGGK
ncbi:phosphatidylglycerol:prolipoprotein diacylglycerol transferase [Elusimicrobium posterum]|uniref:prolipoprotein diacylglyceryl transferase n=1 Tax=Elusimicrobium posterum TaxID=3116653 RepID=UPI003C718778